MNVFAAARVQRPGWTVTGGLIIKAQGEPWQMSRGPILASIVNHGTALRRYLEYDFTDRICITAYAGLAMLCRLLPALALVAMTHQTALAAKPPELCPRPAAGGAVPEPENLRSRDGELHVDLTVRNTREPDGSVRYCYVLPDGAQSDPAGQARGPGGHRAA
jgi:hypothetical protein